MIQRLPKALAQVQAGNISENLRIESDELYIFVSGKRNH